MTRYTVTWHPIAQDLLAEIWLASAGQKDVSIASDAIDRELAVDAPEKGQPIGEGFRRLVAPPLEVFYEVIEADRLVRVLHVRRTETSQWNVIGGNGHGESN